MEQADKNFDVEIDSLTVCFFGGCPSAQLAAQTRFGPGRKSVSSSAQSQETLSGTQAELTLELNLCRTAATIK